MPCKHVPLTLRCGVDSDRPPRIAWFHDGWPMRNSATRMVLPEGQSCSCKCSTADGTRTRALYWCTTTNRLGSARLRNATVELATKPYFALVPQDMRTLAEESVEFRCKANGDPKPTVAWWNQKGKEPVFRRVT